MSYYTTAPKKNKKLTQSMLDEVWKEMSDLPSGKRPRVTRTAPRYETRKFKLTKKQAQAIKRKKIREILKELKAAKSEPLKTHDWKYVKLREGSKAWKRAGVPHIFSLICSKEVSDKIINSEHLKKK